MIRNWCAIVLGILCQAVYGQVVYFVDTETDGPVFDVTVYTPDLTKSALSNADGSCDLSSFLYNDRLVIKHLGYHTIYATKGQLLRKGNRVYLTPSRELLDEVVMTASPFRQKKGNVPQKVVSVKPEQVILGQPQTTADLLEQTGQVFVQRSQLGGGSPMIRGFATNRLLITVDGVRMNNAIFRGGNIQNVISIDPLNVSGTEVIFGPASVIYGSDALGGAQNFITRSPRLSETDSLYLEAGALFRVATVNDEIAFHADLNLGKKKWAWYSGFTVQELGDLWMGRNGSDELLRPFYVAQLDGEDALQVNPEPRRQVPTGFRIYHALNKFHWNPGKRTTADFGLHYSTTTDYDRYDRLTRPGREEGTLRSAEWYYGPQNWLMSYGKVTHKPRRGNLDQLRLTAAYQKWEESRHDRDFGSPTRSSNNERVHAYSVNLDTEWDQREPVTWFAGLEYIHNLVRSEGSSFRIDTREKAPIATRYPDGSTWNTAAAYLQLEYERNPRLTWLAGMRYSQFWLESDFTTEFFSFPFEKASIRNGALTGNLGFNWRPSPVSRVSSHFSTGFRAPNVDDVGKIFDSEPGFIVLPNPELGPEYVYNWESGAEVLLFGLLRLQGTGFYSYLDNAIVRRESTLNGSDEVEVDGESAGILSLQNAAFARIYGFEASVGADLGQGWNTRLNLSRAWGTETDEGGGQSPARHVPPLFGDFHLVRKKDRSTLDFFVNFNGPVPFERLADSERNKAYIYQTDENGNPHAPGWYTLNARASVQLRAGFTVTFGVENITDTRFRRYSSGIAAPGRNFLASLLWRL